MPKEIAIKTKGETYYKCKKIWVDACLPVGRVACPSVALAKEGEDYVRVGGNEGDYKVITK